MDLLNLWFNNIENVGYASRRKLLECFGTIENIYNASKPMLQELLPQNKVDSIEKSKNMKHAKYLQEILERKDIKIVYPGHKDYPQKLNDIYDPPHLLYVRGNLKHSLNDYNSNVGVVGSRKCDVYGKEIAKSFSYKLAQNGFNIISGLAMGIDVMSHTGALAANGYTVGVLGCGIDVIYPQYNIEEYMEISKKGAIISEYAPGVKANPAFFPIRNRIISGLSDGLLVIEAKKKSGSLITADAALEQGKQVYAIPGRITDANCEGTNNLIKQGAMCVTSPADIINDLKPNNKYDENFETTNQFNLAPLEKMLYSCLSLEPLYVDDIIDKVKLSVSDTISLLYAMEEKGIIKQISKGYYIISI